MRSIFTQFVVLLVAQVCHLNAYCAPPPGPQTFENLLNENAVGEKGINEPEDPLLEKLLNDADDEHQTAVADARNALGDAINARLNEATQKGDLDKVTKYQEIRAKFQTSKELPSDPMLQIARSTYEADIRTADKTRAAVYDDVTKRYTQQQRFQRARQVRHRLGNRNQNEPARVGPAARNAPAGIVPGRYILRNRASGLALGIEGDARKAGARVVQTEFRPGGFQEWTIAELGEGWFSVRNVGSDMSLAVPGASQVKGTGCIQHPFDPTCLDHRWKIEAVGDGFYRLVNESADFCLGVPGASKRVGEQAIQWPWNPQANDHYWKLEPR